MVDSIIAALRLPQATVLPGGLMKTVAQCSGRLGSNHRQDDVAFLLNKLQYELNSGELVDGAKVNGGGGTYEVHRLGGGWDPQANIPEVHARILLLKKYPHTFHGIVSFAPFGTSTWLPKAIPFTGR